jgi:hypothetical protein
MAFRFDTLHQAFQGLAQQHPAYANAILKARANLTGFVKGIEVQCEPSALMKAVRECQRGNAFVGTAHGVTGVQLVEDLEAPRFVVYIAGRSGLSAEEGFITALALHMEIAKRGEEFSPAWLLFQHSTLVDMIGADSAMLIRAINSGHEPLMSYAFEHGKPAEIDTRPVMMMRCETPSLDDVTWVLQEVHSPHENFRGADGDQSMVVGTVWVNQRGVAQLRQLRVAANNARKTLSANADNARFAAQGIQQFMPQQQAAINQQLNQYAKQRMQQHMDPLIAERFRNQISSGVIPGFTDEDMRAMQVQGVPQDPTTLQSGAQRFKSIVDFWKDKLPK